MTMAPPSQLAETSSKLEVRFGTTQEQRRVTVLFRLILVIPQIIALYFVGIGAYFVAIVGWFAALFTGRLPESMATFLLGYVRWYTRLYAYEFLMVDAYPPFSLEPDPTYPVDVMVITGRLNRAAVFFRLILAIPALIVTSVLTWGLLVFAIITWIVTLVSGKMPDAFFGASAAVIRFGVRTSAYVVMLTSYYPSDVLGDKDTFGTRLESQVSGTFDAQSVALPSYGGYGQVPAWGAVPQGAAAPSPPPPPPAGTFPPPSPLESPGASLADAPAGIPESFGAPTGTPTGTPPGSPTDESVTGYPPPPSIPGAAPSPPYAGAMPPPPPGAMQTPPPVPYAETIPPPPAAMPPPPPGAMPSYPMGPPAGAPSSRWPLLLSNGARALTVVIIVVGAIAYVSFGAVSRSLFSITSIETVVARNSTQAAYSELVTATDTFKSQTQACSAKTGSSELSCLEQADHAWAGAIATYGSALSGITYPSSAQVEANAAQAAARQASAVVTNLANSPDGQTYSTASQSPEFRSALNAVDETYNALIGALSG